MGSFQIVKMTMVKLNTFLINPNSSRSGVKS